MKQKILLLALICLTSLTDVFSQCATTIIASGGTSGNARCPMTRYRNARSHYLITAAEMTAAGFGPGNSIDGISWNYATAPTISGIGNLKVYLENTADVANIKGNNFATAIVPMTMAHSAPVTLPAAAGFFNITFSGGTPFTYSGGGVYVAFDWDYCAGTLDAVGVVSCNTALASGLQGLQNAGACAVLTGLAASAFRPDTKFISTVVNDVKADYIYTIGEMPLTFAPNHVVQARVVNRSNTVFTNYNVNLDILGANSFSNVQTIGTLGACATATVTFPPFTPASIGIDTVRITLPADNNNANNKKDVLQTVSNNRYSYRYGGEAPVTGVGVNAATGVISARFATNTPLTLTDVNVQFNSTGQPYKIAIYPDNLGTPALVPLYIDATDRITTNLPAADQTLTTPVTVPAGNFYVTIHQTGLTNMGVIYAAEAPLRTGTFHYASPAPPASWLDLAPANGFRTLLGVKFCFPFSPDTILGPTTVCANSTNTYSVTPIQDAISYTWTLPGGWAGVSFTNSINAFAGLTGGNITCVANFSCGPSVAKTLTVNISNPTFSSVTPANVSCNGAGNGQIVVTSAAASPVFSINPLATQSPAGTFINLSPATYTITLTDATGCSNTTSVSITEPLVLNATAASTAVCTGALSTLTATGSGGTGPYTYQWIDGIVTNTITINPMKDNTIYEESPSNSNATGPNMVAGNNGVGFKGRALMAFDIAGNVPAGATINTASLQLNCSLTNGGAGAQTHFLHKLSADWGEGTSFAFGAGAGASATPNDATWNTRFFPGTNWITAGGDFNAVATASTVVDATGLYTWTSAQMAADVQNWVNTPATNFGWLLKGIESAPTQAKRYDSRENGNAGNRPQLTINYSIPNVVGNTATLNNMPAGTYTVIVTDANGCTSTSVTSVTVNPLPTVTASPVTQTVCENSMATISGGGAATYTWTGGITDATPFMVVAASNYTVTGTDANGCSNTATAEVLMNAAPVITAGATPNTTCDQTTVTPSASGAGTIVWSGGLTNNVPFVAVATTTYTVTGTDGLGCSASTTVLVTVNPMSGILAPATSNQAQDHGDDFDINYYAANCDLIATVDDGAGGNVLGLTTSTVNVDATAGFHNGQPFVRRWYQITPTNNGSADVVLYINQSDFDDYNAAVALPYLPLPTSGNNADPNIGNIRITKNADAGLGNSPVVITPTANWNGTYWELSFNTPSFSQFRVHSVNPGNVPLPATVTSFSGLKLESSDKLSWTTSSEQNNAYFTLQHSTDGTNFTTIAKVNSKAQNGNSATELNYSSIHATPSLGHNYYRLQQTDLDNKLSVHAQIVDLTWGTNGSTVSIYPNPTRDILNIDLYAATAQNTTVKLLDMSGRVIKQIQAKSAVGMNHIKLSMGEIASGVYTVQVYENNQLSHTSKVKKND